MEEQLINIEKASEIVEMQKECFPGEMIEIVLSVDAFSTTVLMKDEDKNDKNNRNMFIY